MSGFQIKDKQTNGFSSDEHIKAHFNFQSESKKLSTQFWEKVAILFFSPDFLVFIITLFIASSGFYYMASHTKSEEIIEYWKLIIPVVTTYMGYAIGKSKSK